MDRHCCRRSRRSAVGREQPSDPGTKQQMIDVHLPTTDGRELVLTRYTEPEPELSLLLKKLRLELPAQPPPKITAATAPPTPL